MTKKETTTKFDEIVIASNNNGKIIELKKLLPNIHLLTLNDIGFQDEISEPYETFEENAQKKAETVFKYCGKPVLSDDSGLCVLALNDVPGVHSAYYGGLPRSDKKNNAKLLDALKGILNRKAYYKAVICFYEKDAIHFFEGKCFGQILETPQGEGGFGYDPLFVPDGFSKTFAELPLDVKNKLSHRSKAIDQLKFFLEKDN